MIVEVVKVQLETKGKRSSWRKPRAFTHTDLLMY
jgi:hypothetical protein